MPVFCLLCKSTRVVRHCEAATCRWWRCEKCHAFGDDRRFAEPIGKDAA